MAFAPIRFDSPEQIRFRRRTAPSRRDDTPCSHTIRPEIEVDLRSEESGQRPVGIVGEEPAKCAAIAEEPIRAFAGVSMRLQTG